MGWFRNGQKYFDADSQESEKADAGILLDFEHELDIGCLKTDFIKISFGRIRIVKDDLWGQVYDPGASSWTVSTYL